MPMPFGPFVGFPTDDPNARPGSGDQPQMDPQTAMSLMQTLIGSMTGQMNEAAQQPGAPMMDMPQQTNPLAAMGATFSASMADQLTGRTQHLAGVQRTLAQQEQDRLQVQHQNIKTEAMNMRQRQMTRLQFLSQINDVKMKMAQEIGDMEKIEKATLTAQKHDKEMAEINKQNQLDVAEWKAKNTPTPGEKPPDPQADVAEFTEQIENELARKENYEKAGDFFGGGGWTVMKQAPRRRLQTRLYSQAISADSREMREVSLEYYLDTLLDNHGHIRDDDFENPEVQRLMKLLVQWTPDGGDAWLRRHGITTAEERAAAEAGTPAGMTAPDTTNTPSQ